MPEREEASARRQQVLAAIQQASTPPGVSEVAAAVGIHLNTARFHLSALETEGVIERLPAEPSGQGRPRARYRARPGQALGQIRRYQMLAEILLSQLSTADEPSTAAIEAGHAWGAHLITRPAPFHQIDSDEAVERLVAMLDGLDFAPELATREDSRERIRLRHCPFFELADPHRNIVCALHLGLMRGGLAELGAPITVGALEPFAEPDACLAHLAPLRAARAPGEGPA